MPGHGGWQSYGIAVYAGLLIQGGLIDVYAHTRGPRNGELYLPISCERYHVESM
jgi:hypothetical protein